MKKNTMMRIAAILLVCVLASTCGISGTFAKYVTKAEGSDSARVAKWGVTITGLGNAFAEAYDEGKDIKTVVSSAYNVADTENVVAPGTEGKLARFEVGGDAPEVSYELTFMIDTDTAKTVFTNWDSKKRGILVYPKDHPAYGNPEGYYPILGTLKIGAEGNADINVGTDISMQELMVRMMRLAFRYDVETGKYSYTLDKTADNPKWESLNGKPVLEATWRWAFAHETDGDYPYKDRLTAEDVDEYDTVLGNLAAGMKYYKYNVVEQRDLELEDGKDYSLNISFTVTATIVQID